MKRISGRPRDPEDIHHLERIKEQWLEGAVKLTWAAKRALYAGAFEKEVGTKPIPIVA